MNPSGKSLNHLLPGGQVDRTAMNIMACIMYKYISVSYTHLRAHET